MTTPTNEAGHGLPELPEPDFVTPDDNLYTVHTMRRYARDYAAALALSRGVPADMVLVPREPTMTMLQRGSAAADGLGSPLTRTECAWNAMLAAAPAAAGAQGEDGCDCMGCGEIYSHGEGWFTCPYCKGTGKEIKEPQPPAAAGGVRARQLLAAELRNIGYPSSADELAAGASVEDKNVLGAALRAIEAALTQQQTAAAEHWHDLYRKECQLRQDDAARYGQQIVDLEAALSSHRQAGDDQFRELAESWSQHGEALHANGFDIRGAAMHKCARELLALVEKGAGNG